MKDVRTVFRTKLMKPSIRIAVAISSKLLKSKLKEIGNTIFQRLSTNAI